MGNWWHNRTSRERWIISIGGVVAILVIFFEVLLSPLNQTITHTREQLNNQQVISQWAKQTSEQVRALQAAGYRASKPDTGAILVVVERSLNQNKLAAYLRNVQQPQSDQLQLQFIDVPFDSFISWLQQLSKQYGIKTSKLNIKRTPIIGVVDAAITLDADKKN